MKKLYLTKTKRLEKLSKTEQEDLVLDLVNAIVSAGSLKEAALFLQDLLTRSEMKTLAKRLRIAKLLLQGLSYEDIENLIYVSHGTIAKIAAWLSERGDGFRDIINRLPKKSDLKSWEEISEADSFKRRYPLYFWPEILLDEVIKGANRRQKDRIINVLKRLNEKSSLHKRIEKLLKYSTT